MHKNPLQIFVQHLATTASKSIFSVPLIWTRRESVRMQKWSALQDAIRQDVRRKRQSRQKWEGFPVAPPTASWKRLSLNSLNTKDLHNESVLNHRHGDQGWMVMQQRAEFTGTTECYCSFPWVCTWLLFSGFTVGFHLPSAKTALKSFLSETQNQNNASY